jgi:hypothetical protein
MGGNAGTTHETLPFGFGARFEHFLAMKCAHMRDVELFEVRLEVDLSLEQHELGLEFDNLSVGRHPCRLRVSARRGGFKLRQDDGRGGRTDERRRAGAR